MPKRPSGSCGVYLGNGTPIVLVDCRSWNTLLHNACSVGHANLVWKLLERGANANISNNESILPIVYAFECGSFEVVKLLAEIGPDLRKLKLLPLVRAVAHGHLDIVNYFYRRGVDLLVKERGGQTALSVACNNNH